MLTRNAAGIALFFCAAGLAVSAADGPAARDPRLGYWVEESRSDSYPQSEGLQLLVEDLGRGVTRYTLGANHAPQNKWIVAGRCDGSEHDVVKGTGDPWGNSAACRVLGPRAVATTTTPGNRQQAAMTVLIEAISEDGNDMMGNWTSWNADGKVLAEGFRHFTRRQRPAD
jgi:hypothetical protein